MRLVACITLVAACASQGAAACPAAADLTPAHLWGLWRVSFDGGGSAPATATVLFEKHPERTESVRGAVNRDSVQSLLAGDVDDGVLALDESDDGLQISATWSGNVVPISCGKEFTGLWRRAKDNTVRSFVLRKLPGWQ
jgi:ABC-type nitrate/sulfonate/bicarbonate transport system substrate-binding protein